MVVLVKLTGLNACCSSDWRNTAAPSDLTLATLHLGGAGAAFRIDEHF
jgi:hypothetical protein